MRNRNILIAVGAAFFGFVAVYLANVWFSSMGEREIEKAEEYQLARIVAATQPLEFGQPLTDTNLRMVNWPADSVPTGSFTSIEAAMRGGRVALRAIVPGEPILASKVSGTDGRATLAANLPDNMRAVAIPVNAIAGVGGFVRPGDVVDVILTRQIPGDGASTTDKMTTVVLENALVLAVDQQADENATEPSVSQTVTLQVDMFGAQKLVLAHQVGSLSLVLRNVENQVIGGTETVVANDLGGSGLYIPGRRQNSGSSGSSQTIRIETPQMAQAPRAAQAQPAASAPAQPRGPTMTVIRGTEGSTYPVERYRGW